MATRKQKKKPKSKTKAKTKSRERVLPSRKKRASKGRVIRVSDEVFNHLKMHRDGKDAGSSWDKMFRRMLGLPDRYGNSQKLKLGWLEIDSGILFPKKSQAMGQAVIEMAKRGYEWPKKPIKMREVRW